MATAIDYSQGHPTADSVRAAGHSGVVRYVGTPGRTKNITAAEYRDMTSKGVGVALVYENHAGDAAGGFAAGQTAARNARADANAIGFPANKPIYFAIDSDQVTAADFAAVSAYLDGIASILGDRALVGVYGEYDVIEKNVGTHARLGWQTAAWSGGKRSSKAALFQRLGQTYVGGTQVDINDILAADWGQHNAQEEDLTPDEHNELDQVHNQLISKWPSFVDGSVRMTPVDFIRAIDENVTRQGAVINALLAKADGASADEVAAKLLPALSSALATAVAGIDVSQLDKLSNEDVSRIVNATVTHAGELLTGSAS
jgi:hypothetical protein